jgi:hypothetical protein
MHIAYGNRLANLFALFSKYSCFILGENPVEIGQTVPWRVHS